MDFDNISLRSNTTTIEDDDPIAAYFKSRQFLRSQDSGLENSRFSSTSTASLGKASVKVSSGTYVITNSDSENQRKPSEIKLDQNSICPETGSQYQDKISLVRSALEKYEENFNNEDNYEDENIPPNITSTTNKYLSKQSITGQSFTLPKCGIPDYLIKQGIMTPETPQVFRDELGSLVQSTRKGLFPASSIQSFKDLSIQSSEFEPYEKAVERLAEDERDCDKIDAISHNSNISQFSTAEQAQMSINFEEAKKVSIEDYFKTFQNNTTPERLDETIKSKNDTITHSSAESAESNSTSLFRNFISNMDPNMTENEMYDKLLNIDMFQKDYKKQKNKTLEVSKTGIYDLSNNRKSTPINRKKSLKENENHPMQQNENINHKVSAIKKLDSSTPKSRYSGKPRNVIRGILETKLSSEPKLLSPVVRFSSNDETITDKEASCDGSRSDLDKSGSVSSYLEDKSQRSVSPQMIEAEGNSRKISSGTYTPKKQNTKIQNNRSASKLLCPSAPSKSRSPSPQPYYSSKMKKSATPMNPRYSETISLHDTVNVEDSIATEGLGILTAKLKNRTSDADLMELVEVVKQLDQLATGAVDCSSLIPVIREHHPELLHDLSFNESIVSEQNRIMDTPAYTPGSWAKLPLKIGYETKLSCFVNCEKEIFVPITNITRRWLLCRVQNVIMADKGRKAIVGSRKSNCSNWSIQEFIIVSLKDFILPPHSTKDVRVIITPRLNKIINLKIDFLLTDMITSDNKAIDLDICIFGENPMDCLHISPRDAIHFKKLPESCSTDVPITITNSGKHGLPIPIRCYIKPNSTDEKFKLLLPNFEKELSDCKNFTKLLKCDEKVDLIVRCETGVLNNSSGKQVVDFMSVLVVDQDVPYDDGHLFEIPICVSVGSTRFHYRPELVPFLLEVPAYGQSVTKLFPIRNVGCVPLEFSCSVIVNEGHHEPCPFSVPSTMIIDEEDKAALPITFSGRVKHRVDGVLQLRLVPNGNRVYEFPVIGSVANQVEKRSISRCTDQSVMTTDTGCSNSTVPIRLQSTCNGLSWTCLPLKKELVQSFKIKNASNVKAIVRISFKMQSDSFHLVNKDGEKCCKLKVALKGDEVFDLSVLFCPLSLGPHYNVINIETNSVTKKSMITVSGYGGTQKLSYQNLSSDLNGQKMIRLIPHPDENAYYTNDFTIMNHGVIPGFVYIKPSLKNPALSNNMTLSAKSVVIQPNSHYRFTISQKLKREDWKDVLKDKDIGNIETLSILMGDEPSRLRLRRLVQNGKVEEDDLIKSLISVFHDECDMNLTKLRDEKNFKLLFFKSLKCVDVAVVIERADHDSEDSTIIETGNEDTVFFTSIQSARDMTELHETPFTTNNIKKTSNNSSRVSQWVNSIPE